MIPLDLIERLIARLRRKTPLRLWETPGLFTAWGFEKGDFSGAQLGVRAAAAGFAWVAVQNGQVTASDIDGLRAAGLKVVVWDTLGLGILPGWLKPDGLILQVEGPGSYLSALHDLDQAVFQTVERAVVTTFGGMNTPELTREMVKRIDTCLVECYAPDGPPHGDTGRMIWQAHAYGWPQAHPVIGLYHDAELSTYDLGPFGHGFSVYVAEEMRDQDWAAVTTLLRSGAPSP